jgi:transcriptional regulator GlxA family with amidase domain
MELLQLEVGRALGAAGTRESLVPVWDAVAIDLARPWTVDDLAGLAAVSGEQLRRLCRQQLGYTPMQQVTRMRMQRAATMLQATPGKIAAIAASVGYANRFAFSAAFARWIGRSPGSYRREAARSAARAGN